MAIAWPAPETPSLALEHSVLDTGQLNVNKIQVQKGWKGRIQFSKTVLRHQFPVGMRAPQWWMSFPHCLESFIPFTAPQKYLWVCPDTSSVEKLLNYKIRCDQTNNMFNFSQSSTGRWKRFIVQNLYFGSILCHFSYHLFTHFYKKTSALCLSSLSPLHSFASAKLSCSVFDLGLKR